MANRPPMLHILVPVFGVFSVFAGDVCEISNCTVGAIQAPLVAPLDACNEFRTHAEYLAKNVLHHARGRESEVDEFVSNVAQRKILRDENLHFRKKGMKSAVVDMRMPENLQARLKHEIARKTRLQRSIDSLLQDDAWDGYHLFSTDFHAVALLLPSVVELYDLNQDIVKATFPNAVRCTLNGFGVGAGRHAFGVHNANEAGEVFSETLRNGYEIPREHHSFHIALDETSYDFQPLILFDDFETVKGTPLFLYEAILARHNSSAEELDVLKKALFFMYRLDEENTLNTFSQSALHMYARFLEKEHCYFGARPPAAYYWKLQPGQAIYFDNHVPHGARTLPTAQRDRVTADFRCFAEVPKPGLWSMAKIAYKSYFDLGYVPNPEVLEIKTTKNFECFLKLVGYKDLRDFAAVFYDQKDVPNWKVKKLPAYFEANLGFMIEDFDEFKVGVERHFNHIRAFLEKEDVVLNDEFITCAKRRVE